MKSLIKEWFSCLDCLNTNVNCHRHWVSTGVVILIGSFGVAGCLPLGVFESASEHQQVSDLTEVKATLTTLNRAQQAYYIETGTFAPTLEDLQIGLPEEIGFYKLAIAAADDQKAIMTAKTPSYKQPNFSAGTFFVATPEPRTITILCEGETFSENPPPVPQLDGDTLVCSGETSAQSRE